MNKIRVLVCDDMPQIRMLYGEMLNKSEKCECVGNAANEQETLYQTNVLKPDIVLLDIQMDELDSGLRVLPQILEISPVTKVIMVTVSGDGENIFKAMKLGAKDYFLKDQSFDEIIETIEAVYNNEHKMRDEIVDKIMGHYEVIEKKQESLLYIINKLIVLAPRELEVLKELCNGLSYSDIAEKLVIEEVTVRVKVVQILKKMEYNNIKTLVEYINKMGVFTLFNN